MPDTKILIVEDDFIVAEDIKSSLMQLGFAVSGPVPSGEKAIEKVKEDNPDLVLMDIVLEGEMSGIEAADIIQSQSHIPVIYLTAYADEDVLARAKVTEPFGYVLKPFEDRELNTAIEIALYKHKMEMKLRESEQWYSTTLLSVGDAVIATDKKGLIKSMNKVAEELTDWTQEEAAGKPLPEVFHIINEQTRERCENPVEKVLETGKIIGLANDTVLIKKNKNEIIIADSGAPIRDINGEIVGVVLVFRDITEKIAMEVELRQAQKMESIGTLAGGIAHDFNNILGIILGNTELSLDDIPEWNPAHMHMKEIRQACLRARDVVRQLLSFARKEEQKQKPLKLAPIIKESLTLLRSSIPASIDIRNNITTDSETIMGDPTQIHQVLLNLCTNATDAMYEKGGVLDIRLDAVTIGEDTISSYPGLDAGGYVKLSVSDTGEGIPDNVKNNIFEPYFTTKEIGKGTGMGLAVVHGIVGHHHGMIKVDTEPGRGTSFNVMLPVIEEEEVISQIPEKIQGGNEKILFVDDEESMVRIGVQGLEKLGYQVVGTTDPVEAIELLKTNIDSLHLVITDMTMPGMTGVTLARELVKIRSDIPVILCTGYSEKIDKKKAEEIGVHSVLMKPLVMSEIAQTIRRVLNEGTQTVSTGINRILVVDDEEQMRSKLRLMLESEGYEITEAPDGNIALWLYKEKPSDLIVLDIIMPEKEGLETITELKREFPDVKILAISGGGTGDAGQYLSLAKTMGADSILAKPFEKEELLKAVKEILG